MDYLRSHWTLEMYVAPILYLNPTTDIVMTLQVDLYAGLENHLEHEHFFMKWWDMTRRMVGVLNRLDLDCHIQPWPCPRSNPYGLKYEVRGDQISCPYGPIGQGCKEVNAYMYSRGW